MSRIALLLAAVMPAIALSKESAADEAKPMEEIHLIHHSHTDLGYTDLASTAMALHVSYIGQAVQFADATAEYPEESRFRWTCESALMVERFLRESSAEEKARFAAAVRRGQIEVTAMPDNIVGLLDAAEWDAVARRLSPLWKTYAARVAMQNDINGFPWGLLPKLREHAIDAVWMGCNGDTSVPLSSRPEAWWWEGADGKRVLAWSGTHYCFGFELFHAAEWRRGPVPSSGDVWYNPPSPGETWKTSKADLDAAEQVLRGKLARMGHYKFPVVAFQVTNMWRMDNDPPSRQIADFVKAWNAEGRKPRLVMSTPSRFLDRLRETSADKITTVRRGDWQDWWSDGTCTTPELLVANQQAKRILADLPAAARVLGVGPKEPLTGYNAAWLNAILFDEHTWGSYNSIAQPYHPRTAGGLAEKSLFAYRALERAQLARTAMFRKAKDYCDFSRTRFIRVLNPGTTPRSGWVVIPATAIRFAASAARDAATQEVFPLEDLREPEWSDPDLKTAPYDRPNDVWAWQVKQRRFFLANLAAGQTRDFELVNTAPAKSPLPPGEGKGEGNSVPVQQPVALRPSPGKTAELKVTWDEPHGRIASLRTADGMELVDAAAAYGLGQLVVESIQQRGQRYVLADRNQALLAKLFHDEPPKLLDARIESTRYAASLITNWEHPLIHRVQQRWDVHKGVPRAELTTTIWTKELADPCALYLAFPLRTPHAPREEQHHPERDEYELVYDSIGQETVFGRDNMPGTCAEALCQNAGLIFRNPAAAVLLATPDTPLGCVGGPALRRRLIAPFTPPNSHYYVNVTNNYWHTNFSILKAGKLVLHHWIEPADPRTASLAMLSDELWAYPVHGGGSDDRT
jgi:hypothetical protein